MSSFCTRFYIKPTPSTAVTLVCDITYYSYTTV